MLSDAARDALKQIVVNALTAALEETPYQPEPPEAPELSERRGCFVTLKTDGRLRGCLGCFTSDLPLYEAIARMTRDSALEDPRFAGNRLKREDLAQITFDVSVLSPLEPCADPEGIELGVHGIYVREGMRSGCFLPQVATEVGWTVEEFWSNCCSHKAGLAPDAWRHGDVELFTFTAEIIEGSAAEQ